MSTLNPVGVEGKDVDLEAVVAEYAANNKLWLVHLVKEGPHQSSGRGEGYGGYRGYGEYKELSQIHGRVADLAHSAVGEAEEAGVVTEADILRYMATEGIPAQVWYDNNKIPHYYAPHSVIEGFVNGMRRS